MLTLFEFQVYIIFNIKYSFSLKKIKFKKLLSSKNQIKRWRYQGCKICIRINLKITPKMLNSLTEKSVYYRKYIEAI